MILLLLKTVGFLVILSLPLNYAVSCSRFKQISRVFINCSCIQNTSGYTSSIQCVDRGLNATESVSALNSLFSAKNLESLIFTGNNIENITANILGEFNHVSLTTLNLSSNHIEHIQSGAFHYMKNLKTLILDDNLWNLSRSQNRPRVFNHSNMETLSLRSTLMPPHENEFYEQKTHEQLYYLFEKGSMESLVNLHLDHNSLIGFNESFFKHLHNLVNLTLSANNLIRNINIGLLKNLQVLDLRENEISSPDQTFIDDLQNASNLTHVYLKGNHFGCDCELIVFYNWLKSDSGAIIADRNELTCYAADQRENVVGRRIIDLTEDLLTCKSSAEEVARKKISSYTVLGVVIGLVSIVAIVVLYMNRGRFLNRFYRYKEQITGKHDHLYSTAHYSAVPPTTNMT